jgi:mxaJ protein
MSSASKALAISVLLLAGTAALAVTPPLRVCADPSDLPFSNMREQGFENVLAKMVAKDLHREIQFVWWPQQAEFMEKWLKAGRCDLVMAVPATFDLLTPTRPYYRSSYVFVSRSDRHIRTVSLNDSALRNYRIGAQIVGDDGGAMVPPAEEMVKRGMLRNLVGYSLYGHPTSENPSAEIISAVEKGDVDIAIAWGPLAGYFARHSDVPLTIRAICPVISASAQPFQFDIAMGVRRGDDLLVKQLNDFIVRREKDIHKLLAEYAVPTVNESTTHAECR